MSRKITLDENELNHTVLKEVEHEENKKNLIREVTVPIESEFRQKPGQKTVINRKGNAADPWCFSA